MRDLTYVKLIFFGKKPETELADAKYDGKINPLDFIQIKLIIVGKEKEITIDDSAERIVTVSKPIERVITLGGYDAEVLRLFGAVDKIVGVSSWMPKKYFHTLCIPELSKLPTVGSHTGRGTNLDYEAIFNLNPDLVNGWYYNIAEVDEKLPGITVVGFDFFVPETIREEIVKFGYIFDKKDEAKHYIDDFHDKYLNHIKTRTEGLSDKNRPKVYVERHNKAYLTYASASYVQQGIYLAGGKNIFADLPGSQINVDPEEVLTRNPDVIIKYGYYDTGYGIDDISKAKESRDEIMNRPELANVNAVKNGRVYIMHMSLNLGPKHPIAKVHWAKWFQSNLFEDLDPHAIHQEYLKCQDIDYDLNKHGVFVYHPEEHPDGK
jgi:iron complex transport system substrate-binding protein